MRLCSIEDCAKTHYALGFCKMHYSRLARYGDVNRGFRTLEERFWQKVKQGAPDECWIWQAARTSFGYGEIGVGRKVRNAHVVAYELLVGPISEGLELDHLCRNPPCVNPAHLEPVTHRENMARAVNSAAQIKRAKTHCPQGHPYSGPNLYLTPRGRRECRTCRNSRRKR